MTDSPNTPLRGKSIMPSLTVDNLQQSLDFFGGLGFEVENRWEEKGVLLGAMLKAGEARLGLSQDDGKKGRDRLKGVGVRLYIETADDVDAVAARAKAAGIALTSEPANTDWGSRAFEVKEPSGFLLTIASRPAS
ncbi:MAG: VOC family protein [Vicinamibacterales bacterium]